MRHAELFGTTGIESDSHTRVHNNSVFEGKWSVDVPTAAKYPLPQRWLILRNNCFLIGSQPIIKGRSLIYCRRGGGVDIA